MKQNEKPKQGILRLLEVSGETNTPFIGSVLLSICGTLLQLMPYLSAYQVMAELLRHAAAETSLNTGFMIRWALLGLASLIAGYVWQRHDGAHLFLSCNLRRSVKGGRAYRKTTDGLYYESFHRENKADPGGGYRAD